MTGPMSVGTTYPCESSHARSEPASVERSVTVSNGPTVPSWSTWTPLLLTAPLDAASETELEHPQSNLPLFAHASCEAFVVTRVVVTASRASNQASVDSSSTASGATGSTQPNSDGSPVYLIWSHSTVRSPVMANAMR